MRRSLSLLILLALLGVAHAQPTPCPPAAPPHRLVIGTVPVAPFIIHDPDGTWRGISIDLWQQVAREAGLDYQLRELTAADLGADGHGLAGLDGFVSLNASYQREQQLDLTHPFYSTGLAIAVAPHHDDGLGPVLAAIVTARFGKLIAALVATLAAMGLVMWLVERRHNPQFGGSASSGIGNGVWWSAVTMTTVGYGDKAPVTVAGRALALVWMFAALIVISTFTGGISSALTVSHLATGVAGPDDLPDAKVGAVEPSAGARYLQAHHVGYRGYPDAAAAVAALARGEVDAVVHEQPILRYQLAQAHATRLRVLDGTFENHGYVFALAPCSPHREAVNLAILKVTASDHWPAILGRYLDGR